MHCAGRLRPWDLPPLVPMLLDRWQYGPPAVHTAARTVLDRVPADVLAHLLRPRVEAAPTVSSSCWRAAPCSVRPNWTAYGAGLPRRGPRCPGRPPRPRGRPPARAGHRGRGRRRAGRPARPRPGRPGGAGPPPGPAGVAGPGPQGDAGADPPRPRPPRRGAPRRRPAARRTRPSTP
ncbi:hypothetical protein LUR56_08275 [Streptomyces sp. MT29]|nr:hypothetical protein [Streptomyces sp. MT29]